MTLKIVPKASPSEERKQEAIAILREALELAEKSEIASIIMGARKPNGDWLTWSSGQESIVNAVGQLEIMKMGMIDLKLNEEDDAA